jgi:hypothetical protein
MSDHIRARSSFVRAAFERKNQLGKGKTILSDKDRVKQKRSYSKSQFRKEIKRSSYDDSSFFYFENTCKYPVWFTIKSEKDKRMGILSLRTK